MTFLKIDTDVYDDIASQLKVTLVEDLRLGVDGLGFGVWDLGFELQLLRPPAAVLFQEWYTLHPTPQTLHPTT